MPPEYRDHTNPSPEGYITKDKSTIRELLHPDFVSGLGMSLAEAVVEPGMGTAAHLHEDFDEIYYCLEGEGQLFIDGLEYPFTPHSFYLMPTGSIHSLKARTRLRLLCICCPGYTHRGTRLAE